MHVGSLQIFTIPKKAGPDFVHDIVTAFRAPGDLVEPFNLRLTGGPLAKVSPSLRPTAEVDMDYHVRHTALPAPGGERELGDLISHLHGVLLDRSRPLWTCHVIEGLKGGRFAVYMKMHHSVTDGVNGMRLATRSLATSPTGAWLAPWLQPAAPKGEHRNAGAGAPAKMALYDWPISLGRGVLGLLPGMTRPERVILLIFLGALMGLLPAWIAEQPFQVVLFGLLGGAAAFFDKYLRKNTWRIALFAGLGLLFGALPSLAISPTTALVNGVLGLIIGAALGMQLGGQLFSNLTMRSMDILLAFPSYLLAIAIVAFLGPGLEKGMIAIGIVSIPVFARLVRSSVLSVSRKEYILAAESVGEGHGRVIFYHILPNVLSPITVQTTLGLGSAILAAAALGFLGLGAVPPEPEWGAMLGDSYRYLTSGAWWAVVFPGMAIMLCVLGFNLLGDGLRDALDPKLKI